MTAVNVKDAERLKWEFDDLFNLRLSGPRRLHGREEDLRHFCRLSCEKFSDVVPLKTFTLVGATIFDLNLSYRDEFNEIPFPNGDDKVEFSNIEKDTKYFRDFVTYLIRSGIPVSPDFEVSVENLLYGQDYLESDTKSDVTMFCYLPKLGYEDLVSNENEDEKEYYLEDCHYKIFDESDAFQNEHRAKFAEHIEKKEYAQAFLEARYLGGVCSALSTPENWSKRLCSAGSKVITTEHGKDSLPIHLMGNNSMVSVINQRHTHGLPRAIKAEIAQKSCRLSIDVAMSEPFINEVLSGLTNQTLMAMKIKHDRTGSMMPDMSKYSEWGSYTDDSGDNFIPYPPYRKPFLMQNDKRLDVNFQDVFWALAENFDNPNYGNVAYGWRVDDNVRAVMKERIAHYLGTNEKSVLPVLGAKPEVV